MKINGNLKYFVSVIIWTIGVALIKPYEIPGDIRNQITLGMLVTIAGFVPLYKKIISIAKETFKKSDKPTS